VHTHTNSTLASIRREYKYIAFLRGDVFAIMLNRKKNRQRRIIAKALRGWYGPEFAEKEMSAYPGDGVKLSSIVDGLLSKMFSGDELVLMELKEKWTEIAGVQIAGISRPVSIRDNLLCVEVDHSLWLRELMGPTKGLLIKNINDFCGAETCREIRFVPVGRYSRTDSTKKEGEGEE